MKQLFLLVSLSCLFRFLAIGQCPTGPLTLSTQSAVDSFPIRYPGCSVLTHDLIVGTTAGGNQTTNITSLAALSQITETKAELLVVANASLPNLNGLHNLKRAKWLALSNLNGLTNLSGLDGLESADTLSMISVLVTSLAGLEGLREVGTFNLINSNIADFSSLNNLVRIRKEFLIFNNTRLASLQGLGRLKSVGGDFTITGSNLLQNLSGLDSLENVRALIVDYNSGLTSLSGMPRLQSAGSVRLANSENVTQISGIEHITEIKDITLTHNPRLQSLAGLQNIRALRYLILEQNSAMTSWNGAPNLDSLEFLAINDMPFVSLAGIPKTPLLKTLKLSTNQKLVDIGALDSLNRLSTLIITFNPKLSYCAVPPICAYLAKDPSLKLATKLFENAPGCNNDVEISWQCGATPILVSVLVDSNNNCQADSGDVPVEDVMVQLWDNSGLFSMSATQSNGPARLAYFNPVSFRLKLPQFPSAYWDPCPDSFLVTVNGIDTIFRTFLLQPLNECPNLNTTLGLPPAFRGCLATTPMTVKTQNLGAVTATSSLATVILSPLLEVVTSVPPVSGQQGDTLYFQLGSLPPFGIKTIHMTVKTKCDSVLNDRSACVEAFSTAQNNCSGGGTYSDVRLFSQCLGDSVRFTLKNVGTGPTQGLHEYVIIEDEIIMRAGNFNLGPRDSMFITVPSDGSTYRMEATKDGKGHKTATAREGCNGFTPGFITAHWFDQIPADYDFDCREIRAAYDPNQKTAIPKGVGSDHIVAANQAMLYTIEFQNTGKDTAYRVLLRDDLSSLLDIGTFRPVAASHEYKWQILEGNRLEVLFQPIALPDSGANQVASNGFFSFSIAQKPNLPNGTKLENKASIVFDFNPPIVTNTATHVIGKLLNVAAYDPKRFDAFWEVRGNPMPTSATFFSKNEVKGDTYFTLTDATGHLVRTARFSGRAFVLERENLPAGLYFFQLRQADGAVFAGKVVVGD